MFTNLDPLRLQAVTGTHSINSRMETLMPETRNLGQMQDQPLSKPLLEKEACNA